MQNIIITTPEDLHEIVSKAISEVFPRTTSQAPPIDSITLNDALELLREHGYPTSKAKMYKLTSLGKIPCKTYGNKLVFSRKELLQWAESQTKPKHNSSTQIALTLARSSKRKR